MATVVLPKTSEFTAGFLARGSDVLANDNAIATFLNAQNIDQANINPAMAPTWTGIHIHSNDIRMYSGYDIKGYSDTGSTLKYTLDAGTGSYTSVGDSQLNSAANFSVYSDVGSTLKFKVTGSSGDTTIAGDITTVAGKKLGLGASNTYISLSATNPQFIIGGVDILDINGSRIVSTVDFLLNPTFKLRLDGSASGNTHISEGVADNIYIVAGGHRSINIDSAIVTLDARLDSAAGQDIGTSSSTFGSGYFNKMFVPGHSTTGSGANAFIQIVTGEILRSTSSIKYKEGISELELNSSNIDKLRPVSYTDKKDKKRYFGLIAEEVDKVFPDLVCHTPDGDCEGVFYDRLSVLLLAEIQKIKKELSNAKSALN